MQDNFTGTPGVIRRGRKRNSKQSENEIGVTEKVRASQERIESYKPKSYARKTFFPSFFILCLKESANVKMESDKMRILYDRNE